MDKKGSCQCPKCGATFTAARYLNQHLGRKTPCFVEDNGGVNKCSHCNKTYSTKYNLTKHTKTCKMRDGGVDKLPIDVQANERLRIIQEENAKEREESAKNQAAMQETLKFMAEEIKKLTEKLGNQQPITINNNGVTNNINNGIIHNHFAAPNVEHLFSHPEQVRRIVGKYGCRLPEELMKPIYFDKNHPENMTVHCISDRTGEYMVHGETGWEYAMADTVVDKMRLVGYKTAERMIDEHCVSEEHKDYGRTIKQYENVYDKDTERELNVIRKIVAEHQEITKKIVPKK